MAEHHVKSFAKPDEVLEFPRTKVRVVELGDITVGHFVNEAECVGEVETVGRGVRGVAVHEAARIMGEAAGDEILVSETTRLFAGPDLTFADRGVHTLKGLDGEWRLSAFVSKADQA